MVSLSKTWKRPFPVLVLTEIEGDMSVGPAGPDFDTIVLKCIENPGGIA